MSKFPDSRRDKFDALVSELPDWLVLHADPVMSAQISELARQELTRRDAFNAWYFHPIRDGNIIQIGKS